MTKFIIFLFHCILYDNTRITQKESGQKDLKRTRYAIFKDSLYRLIYIRLNKSKFPIPVKTWFLHINVFYTLSRVQSNSFGVKRVNNEVIATIWTSQPLGQTAMKAPLQTDKRIDKRLRIDLKTGENKVGNTSFPMKQESLNSGL